MFAGCFSDLMTEWGEHPLPACPGPGPDAHMLHAQELVRTHRMTGMISLGGQAGETAQNRCRRIKKMESLFPPVTYGRQVMLPKARGRLASRGSPREEEAEAPSSKHGVVGSLQGCWEPREGVRMELLKMDEL